VRRVEDMNRRIGVGPELSARLAFDLIHSQESVISHVAPPG